MAMVGDIQSSGSHAAGRDPWAGGEMNLFCDRHYFLSCRDWTRTAQDRKYQSAASQGRGHRRSVCFRNARECVSPCKPCFPGSPSPGVLLQSHVTDVLGPSKMVRKSPLGFKGPCWQTNAAPAPTALRGEPAARARSWCTCPGGQGRPGRPGRLPDTHPPPLGVVAPVTDPRPGTAVRKKGGGLWA